MKRILGALGAVIIAVLATASPAFAWHVVDVTVECSEQDSVLTVAVELSDNGPGTYSDSEGNTGSFGAFNSFAYELSTSPSGLSVSVVWFNGETGSASTEGIEQCQPPSTTTTLPTPTTTVPPTTTTVPPPTTSTSTTSTTVAIPVPTTASPIVPTPTLAHTGSGTAWLGLVGLAGLALGLWIVHFNRVANQKAMGMLVDPSRPSWDLRNVGWRKSPYERRGY